MGLCSVICIETVPAVTNRFVGDVLLHVKKRSDWLVLTLTLILRILSHQSLGVDDFGWIC